MPDEVTLARTTFDSNGQPNNKLNILACTEPYSRGYSDVNGTEEADYNTMKTQVLKYGGFFIGRFEAGVNNTTLRTETTATQAVVSKRGVAPYNYVPWGKSMSDVNSDITRSDDSSIVTTTKGAVYLAKNMYTHPDSVTSTLCYGCQWDAICRYIGNSGRTTPKKDALELTGSVTTDVSKNIYDLAGNCYEWTTEAINSDNRVARGGGYASAFPVSYRLGTTPSFACSVVSFRLELYVSDLLPILSQENEQP